MHVKSMEGSWLDHPFWKSGFQIKDDTDIRQLQDSKVKFVWIDTDLGSDVPSLTRSMSTASTPVKPDQSVTNSVKQPPVGAPRSALSEEVARAKKILAQSRSAMQSMFQDARMGKAVSTEHCLPLVGEITQSVERNPGAIVSLARLKTSDDYTYMHSVAVCALMVSLGHQLHLDTNELREAGMAGLVHDLGKALMPLEVLNKPGKLTDEEFAIMKSHPEAGYRMLLEANGVGPIPLDVCLHHHEKINGRGYPHGLQGAEISLFAKMGAVCDVYDAITSNRPYKSGWDPAESVQKMVQWTKEGHFDEVVFKAFIKSIGIYPTGSLVRLQSGRLAVVVEQNAKSLLKPQVRTFFSTKADQPIPPELLDLGKSQDHIVGHESPADWGFPNLEQYWS
jgi:HD-GYP domain-containing protein (c-di-GMP phosphodiesterase class II)